MNAFLIALSFLTRIPVFQQLNYESTQMTRSVLWYPFIGLLIGAVLVLIFFGISFLHFSSFVMAAVLLGIWMVITGALHWDGLADCADAWLAGGDKEKTLAILKDTHCGAGAIVVVGVCLIIFCAVLESIINQEKTIMLLVAPMLARGVAVLLMITTSYVREGGLGEALTKNISRIHCLCVLLAVFCITVFLLRWQSVIVIGGLGILFLLLRRLMQARISGITGDTIGALIVLSEMSAMLLSLVKF